MPFKSQAQRRWMFAAEDRGEVPEGTAERWAHHTKDMKHLPEHIRHKKSALDAYVEVLANSAASLILKEAGMMGGMMSMARGALGQGAGGGVKPPMQQALGNHPLLNRQSPMMQAGAAIQHQGHLMPSASVAQSGSPMQQMGAMAYRQHQQQQGMLPDHGNFPGGGAGGDYGGPPAATGGGAGGDYGAPAAQPQRRYSAAQIRNILQTHPVTNQGNGVMSTVLPKTGADLIEGIAEDVAQTALVTKLASDVGVTADFVGFMAQCMELPTSAFVKKAYADPKGFESFLRIFVGADQPQAHVKVANELVQKIISFLQKGKQGLQGVYNKGLQGVQAVGEGAINKGLRPGGGNPNMPFYSGAEKTRAGLTALGGGAAGAGGLGLAASKALPGGGTHQAPVAPNTAGADGAQASAAPNPVGPGQAPQMSGTAPTMEGGGMNPKLKALLVAGGLTGAGYGAYKGARKVMGKDKKEEQPKVAADHLAKVKRVMMKLANDKIAKINREFSVKAMTTHLDKTASYLPIEKQAAIRTLQKELAAGKDLSYAIKMAYPMLNGEQRGILASQLVRSTIAALKQANSMNPAAYGGSGSQGSVPTQTMSTFTGSPAAGLDFMKSAGIFDNMFGGGAKPPMPQGQPQQPQQGGGMGGAMSSMMLGGGAGAALAGSRMGARMLPGMKTPGRAGLGGLAGAGMMGLMHLLPHLMGAGQNSMPARGVQQTAPAMGR